MAISQYMQIDRPIAYDVAVKYLQQSDPILGQAIAQIGVCRLNEVVQQGDLFSALSKAIISQQISTKAAAAIYSRFLLLYPLKPPTAEDILETPDEMLRQAGLSRPKIVYIKDLAQKVVDALPNIVELAAMDDEEIVQTLMQVKGIGRWTVEMLLIFRLQRLDILPVDDLGIRASIRKIYSLPELPNRQKIISLGQKWQPYRSIASWYLWQSLTLN